LAAWANPTKKSAENVASLVVVLDNSRSMNAAEKGGKTRLEVAKDFLRKTIFNKSSNTQILLLTTAGAEKVACGFTDDFRALDACVDAIEATDLPCAMTQALETARFFQKTRNDAKILVVSDGCFENAETVVKTAVSGGDVAFEKIGGKLENVGIVGFEARRTPTGDALFETMIEAANFTSTSLSCEAEITLDGSIVDIAPLQLAPNERVRKFLKNESTLGGELAARLILPDDAANALLNDDSAQTVLPEFPLLTVLIYGNYDRFMRSAFASQPNVETREIADIPETLGANELLVICGDVPKTLPQGKIAFVNPTSDGDFFTVGEEIGEMFADSETLDGPLTRFLNFRDVSLQGVRNIEFTANAKPTVWVKTPEAPLLFTCGDAESHIVLNFSCSEGALPLRALFPILFANAIGVARGENTGNAGPISSVSCAESNLTSAVNNVEASGYDVEIGGATQPRIWRAFALAALALALLEFYGYCRRFVD
ncbi:MAG: VWA domain-containing protein, partial [Thermoguttaceae bacterium]|nr:VWA domain-containing protein [Thermoguttaceae bacterium]